MRALLLRPLRVALAGGTQVPDGQVLAAARADPCRRNHRRDELREAPVATARDLQLVHDAAYVDAVGTVRATAPCNAGSAFPGRRKWSSVRDVRSARRLPRRVPRSMTASRPTSPAAPITRLRIGRRLLRVQRRRRRRPRAAARSSRAPYRHRRSAMCIRATAPLRSSRRRRPCSPSRCTATRISRSRRKRAISTSPLADGTSDEAYLALLTHALAGRLNRHQPDFVFYLAGADPFEGDRLGRIKLTIEDSSAATRSCWRHAREHGLPVAISMSGGYANDIDSIVTIHANTIRTAMPGTAVRSIFVS